MVPFRPSRLPFPAMTTSNLSFFLSAATFLSPPFDTDVCILLSFFLRFQRPHQPLPLFPTPPHLHILPTTFMGRCRRFRATAALPPRILSHIFGIIFATTAPSPALFPLYCYRYILLPPYTATTAVTAPPPLYFRDRPRHYQLYSFQASLFLFFCHGYCSPRRFIAFLSGVDRPRAMMIAGIKGYTSTIILLLL